MMKSVSVVVKINNILRNVVYPLSRIINIFGSIILLGMMFITMVDVILRYLLNYPIPGAYELVQLMLVLVVFFGLAYTATQKGHIVVEILFLVLPKTVQAIIAIMTSILGIGIFIVAVVSVVQLINVHVDSHAVSGVLEIPLYPISIAVAFGIALLCLVLLTEMIDLLTKG